MEDRFRSYLTILQSVSGDLEQLTDLARRKAELVKRDDLLALDDVLNQEQALALAFRGLEQKRETLLRELGLTGVPLSRLAERFPSAMRAEAKQVITSLQNQYRTYQDCAGQARSLLERSLREIETTLARMGAEPLDGPGYAAHEVSPPPSMKTDFHA